MPRLYRRTQFHPKVGQIWFKKVNPKLMWIQELRKAYPLWTMAQIGQAVCLSRERVRQILKGNPPLPGLTTSELCVRLGAKQANLLQRALRRGIKPIGRQGRTFIWAEAEAEAAILELQLRPRPRSPRETRYCEVCQRPITRRKSGFRLHSPGRFCSRTCQLSWLGKHKHRRREFILGGGTILSGIGEAVAVGGGRSGGKRRHKSRVVPI